MNKILEIGNNFVIAQPGVVKAILDKELQKRANFFHLILLVVTIAQLEECYPTIQRYIIGLGSIINYVQNVEVVYGNGMLGYADCNEYDEKVSKMLRFIHHSMLI